MRDDRRRNRLACALDKFFQAVTFIRWESAQRLHRNQPGKDLEDVGAFLRSARSGSSKFYLLQRCEPSVDLSRCRWLDFLWELKPFCNSMPASSCCCARARALVSSECQRPADAVSALACKGSASFSRAERDDRAASTLSLRSSTATLLEVI